MMVNARNIFMLPLLFSAVLGTSASAQPACENGMKESLTFPAIIERGTISHKSFKRPALYREMIFPAVSKIMTQAEYDALPKPSTYMQQVSVPEKIKTTSVELPLGDIADFDYVFWPDGTTATRKIEEPLLRTVEQDEILEPVKIEYVSKEFIRPEPVRLPDGRLRVMLSPTYKTPWTVPGAVYETNRTYVKSRMPAKYQLSFCES